MGSLFFIENAIAVYLAASGLGIIFLKYSEEEERSFLRAQKRRRCWVGVSGRFGRFCGSGWVCGTAGCGRSSRRSLMRTGCWCHGLAAHASVPWATRRHVCLGGAGGVRTQRAPLTRNRGSRHSAVTQELGQRRRDRKIKCWGSVDLGSTSSWKKVYCVGIDLSTVLKVV